MLKAALLGHDTNSAQTGFCCRSHQYAGRSVKLSGVPRRRTEQRGPSHGSQVPYRRPRSLEEQAADLEFEDISDWKVGGVDPTQ